MYSLVLPDMASFVLSVTACDETEVLPVPRCYFSRCEGGEQSKEDMIIMENLLQQGFVFRENGDDTTNKAHVEMVMREIAKFHAISYCMKVRISIFFISITDIIILPGWIRPEPEGEVQHTGGRLSLHPGDVRVHQANDDSRHGEPG